MPSIGVMHVWLKLLKYIHQAPMETQVWILKQLGIYASPRYLPLIQGDLPVDLAV